MSAAPLYAAAIALRDRVSQDLTAQASRLDALTTKIASLEANAPNELASYVDADGESGEDLQAELRVVTNRVNRARAALAQSDREVQIQRRAATTAYVKGQAPQLAKIRKQFVDAARELLSAFDSLAKWEREAERADLDPLALLDALENTPLHTPRCSRSELAAHLRAWLQTQ